MDEADAYLRSEHPHAAGVATWTLAALRAADPDLEARVRRGWRSVSLHHPDVGYVCGIFPAAGGGVRVFFEHGGTLPDPEGVLEGEGLRGRWLPITSTDEATAERLRGFAHDAVIRRVFR